MRIKIVNTERTPFWGIPEAGIWISSEDNQFLEVDYSKLTPYQQQTIWSAIRMKTIEAEEDEEFQKEFRSLVKEQVEKRQKGYLDNMRQLFGVNPSVNKKAVENVQKVEELKSIMSGSVSTLKRVLVDYPATELELARKIEVHNKNRKTVLKLINELISKQAQKSVSKIENPNAPSQEAFEAAQLRKDEYLGAHYLSNVGDVIESEVEEIKIGGPPTSNDNT